MFSKERSTVNCFSNIVSSLKSVCDITENEPMSRHTTFKIGGNARIFANVPDKDALKRVIKACRDENAQYFIIGNGSDLLVSDDGIDAVVISLGGEFKKMELTGSSEVRCGAGATLASLCSFALSNSLSGLEFAWGIPASVGGAAYMNAGAYGGEMKDVITSVECIDRNGNSITFSADECDYGYRHSIFTDSDYIITGVNIRLKKDDSKLIKERMDDYMSRRKEKQPLEYPSAGSVFKRPEGHFAGALIEQSGLKGAKIGGAQVSEKHAGFIINTGSATCDDVSRLIEHIKEVVFKDSGVMLECEVKTVGGDGNDAK